MAMVLSVFGARLVQLQGIDPHSYAAAASAENMVEVELPARRGDITDRTGESLAVTSEGLMVLADPSLTSQDAPELARLLSKRLDVDYFATLRKLRKDDSRYQYVARRVPATVAKEAVDAAEDAGYDGLWTESDPVRDYPAGDVAANVVGFVGFDKPLAGMEMTFDQWLSGTDGHASYEVGSFADGTKIPLGDNTRVEPVDGKDLTLTIDRDLQWYTQRILMQAVQKSRGESGMAVVMDTKTGEVLALADYPTYDASNPAASPKRHRGIPSLSTVYEPGSVQKVLTVAALLDTGKVTPRTRLTVPPSYQSGASEITDWFDHGTIQLTLAGVIAQSSNIGTVLAANQFVPGELKRYLHDFGLGQKTGVGVAGESRGLVPPHWTAAGEDRIDFGQSISVNALQMTSALNTVANGGVRIDPSLVKGTGVTDDGERVGTDTAQTHRVVSPKAARQTIAMMERVVDPEVGTAPGARIPGYRVAGKTGTAQRANPECGCYDGTYTVSFGGFAPAEDPRFTVYVVVHNPRNGGGGGTVAGPVFKKVMSFALRRYGVQPSTGRASQLPTTW